MATISKYQTVSGATLYRVRYRTPDNRQTDKRGFRTKRDAEDFLIEVEGRKRRGEYVSEAAGKIGVGELGAAWLDRQQGHLKPNSWRAISSRWQVHVEPRWRNTPVSRVAYSDVQAWISELSRTRGAKLVRSAHSVLFGILEDAVRDRRIPSNPASGVKLPRIEKKPHVYLTAQQLHALAHESGRYASLVLLLGTAGLRWGEAAALTVGDIDFLRRTVTVHQNATGGTKGTPKSGQHRTLMIAPYVVEELAITARGKDREELLWPSAVGGYLKAPATHDSWLSGAVRRCQKVAEKARAEEKAKKPEEQPTTPVFPRVTAHDLRHTAASLAISAGANVKAVQRMLGHASAAMTLDTYAALFDDDLAEVADRIEQNVGKMWARAPKTAPETEETPA